MTENKDKLYLEHILEAISSIEVFLKGKTKTDFMADNLLQSAVIRQLTIVGEATKRIGQEQKDRSSYTQWRDIAGFRDVLVHDYFGIDLVSVWNTIEIDLPKLQIEIIKLLDDLNVRNT